MNHSILSDNQAKRLELPLWMLVCFSMFNAWQMGFIYFMGPSLVLDGRTPLPVDMDNVTMLIAAGYIISIIYMIILPHLVVWTARITTFVTLMSVAGLFFPLSAGTLTLLLYIQTFCCCFMIGFETFTISNLFSERSTVLHLTVAYSPALFIVAVVQNDWFPVSFPMFRLLTLVMLGMMLVFFCRLPAGAKNCPRYVRKSDSLRYPGWLFSGIILYSFVVNLMILGGTAAVTGVPNGVFFAYLTDALGAPLLYVLYRKARIHPLDTASVFMGLSAIGFLFLFLSTTYLPGLAYPACVLVGFGFIPCQLMPLYGMTMIKSYPSRFIAPGIIFMALFTVLIHSSLVDSFRTAPELLNVAYLAITLVCIVIYWHLSPYLVYTFQRKISSATTEKNTQAEDIAAAPVVSAPTVSANPLLSQLTARESEVLELISYGYSNRDIAKVLVISEHTVNDYTKKVYRKLNVHSRHAAAQLMLRCCPPDANQ